MFSNPKRRKRGRLHHNIYFEDMIVIDDEVLNRKIFMTDIVVLLQSLFKLHLISYIQTMRRFEARKIHTFLSSLHTTIICPLQFSMFSLGRNARFGSIRIPN